MTKKKRKPRILKTWGFLGICLLFRYGIKRHTIPNGEGEDGRMIDDEVAEEWGAQVDCS